MYNLTLLIYLLKFLEKQVNQMSKNKKWKNKKINFENYKNSDQVKKERRALSDSWKISLTALLLIAIPSFLVFLLMGADGWAIKSTTKFASSRWSLLLPVALCVAAVQSIVIALLIKFKKLKITSLNFLVPVMCVMNSWLVSSGIETGKWFIRVLPAVGLAFLSAVIVIAINKAIAKAKIKKEKQIIIEEERKNKSLLD